MLDVSGLFTKIGTVNTAIIRRDSFLTSELHRQILEHTKILDHLNPSLSIRIRFIHEGLTSIPKCPVCGDPCGFNKNKGELFSPLCGRKCIGKIKGDFKKAGEKIKKQVSELKETLLNLYLANDFVCDEDAAKAFVNERIKQTNYGKKSNWVYSNHYESKKTELLTIFKCTSKILPLKAIDDFKLSERFYLFINEIEHFPLCEVCGEKTTPYINFVSGYQRTCSSTCSYDVSAQTRISNEFPIIVNYLKMNGFDVETTIDEFIGINNMKLTLRHHSCGQIFTKKVNNGIWRRLYCPKCETIYSGKSKEEKEVLDFVKSIYSGTIIENWRGLPGKTKNGKKEIDIYLPDLKLGIEYNGLFYHSNLRTYHFLKFKLAKNLGIHLLQIHSLQWFDANFRRQFKNYLLDLCQKPKKIYGRECEIKIIDKKAKTEFLLKHHFQGDDVSKHAYGLFHKNKLVALMTFGKPRFNKNFEWEIVRFCVESGVHILGGSEKLFKHFCKLHKPKSVISYSDNDFFTGRMYTNLGFTFSHYNSSNYFWWKGNEIVSRYKAKKHNLKNILPNFDKNLSEKENMENNGYAKYYTSGNSVWVWQNYQSFK